MRGNSIKVVRFVDCCANRVYASTNETHYIINGGYENEEVECSRN